MVRKCKEWGLRNKKDAYIAKTTLFQLVQNPFYYGEMIIKGETHQHKYEPLITKDIFMECKAVREGWDKKPFKYAGKEFLFRGLLTCGTTGNVITADTKKKKRADGTVSEWTYLVTWKPEDPGKKMWVREDGVIQQLEEVFKRIGFKTPQLLKCALDAVKETNKAKQ